MTRGPIRLCKLTASLLEPVYDGVCSVYDTYKLPNAKKPAIITFRGHHNGREPPRRHLSGDDGPPGSVPGRVAESPQVMPWVGFSRPGRVLAAQSKKPLEKIFPWSHTPQTHAPRPPRRRTPQRRGFLGCLAPQFCAFRALLPKRRNASCDRE